MSRKILVADDEKDVVEVIKMGLEKEGYQVFEAYDGEEALKKVEETKPDLILLDIMMPKVDGIAVNLKLKQENNTKDIPVIVITGKGYLKEILQLNKEASVVDVLEKPFSIKFLSEKIKGVLKL